MTIDYYELNLYYFFDLFAFLELVNLTFPSLRLILEIFEVQGIFHSIFLLLNKIAIIFLIFHFQFSKPIFPITNPINPLTMPLLPLTNSLSLLTKPLSAMILDSNLILTMP